MAYDRTATNTYTGTRYAPRPQTARTVADAASVKQLSFIEDMVREIHKLQVRELELAQGEHSDQTRALALGTLGTADDAVRVQMAQTFTYGETGTINRLIAARNRHRKLAQEMARRAPVNTSSVSVAGSVALQEDKTYRAPDGRVFRIVRGQSGHLYGKVWIPTGHREGYWDYYQGIRNVAGLELLTLEQAREFGQMTGQCSECQTPLEDPVSIVLGIGPICESKFTGKARSRGKAFRAEVLARATADQIAQMREEDRPALPATDAPF
jgi:hypothetical protein